MNKRKANRNINIIINVLFVYVLLFFLWWWWLLLDKTERVFESQNNYIIIQEYGSKQVYEKSLLYENAVDKHQRQVKMILAEGIVFVALLVVGFLYMRRVLKKEVYLQTQQKDFLLSITHELKLPISSTKLVLETLQSRSIDKPTQDRLIGNVLSDIERLNMLIDKMLLATKMDSKDHGFKRERLDLSRLIQSIIKRQIYHININVEYIEPSLFVMADALGIVSIVVNLIENAQKYSPEKAKISLALHKDRNRAILTIKDEGIGISDEEKDKIFDKFYRIGDEHTRTTKGTGIGLYIVQKMIDFHNARIRVYDNVPQGSIFKISFFLC